MSYRDFSTVPITQSLLTRLFSSIKISTEHFYKHDPCWEWTKSRYIKTDYAQASVTVNKTQFNVSGHKLFYQLFVGFIPHPLVIDHLCRVHYCVNPAHLELVTHKENTARGMWIQRRGPALKTMCSNGHAMIGDNIQYGANKRNTISKIRRYCRRCRNEKERRYQQRKKEKRSMNYIT